eukprot:TRINITY_DN2068_c0_g1_i1.p1 TRINITY_DN2068_c0_g1~~TRINITY_DN2068_c0_g1_i1.p1  ORF type:complete len:176 (+),score=34.58 TRINITY_DN2068_c0_g1_i1:77-604(+)
MSKHQSYSSSSPSLFFLLSLLIFQSLCDFQSYSFSEAQEGGATKPGRSIVVEVTASSHLNIESAFPDGVGLYNLNTTPHVCELKYLPAADFVTLHVELSNSTHHFTCNGVVTRKNKFDSGSCLTPEGVIVVRCDDDHKTKRKLTCEFPPGEVVFTLADNVELAAPNANSFTADVM